MDLNDSILHIDGVAVGALIALSESGIELGIAGTREVDLHDPWKAYGAESPTVSQKR